MRHSDDRILTTHVGSLIRPPALLQHAPAARQDRHLAKTRSGWPLIRRTERMKSHASKQFAHHNSIVLQRRRPAARSELPRGCAEVQAALPALKICAVNRIRCASFDGHGFGRLPLHDPCE